mmetsp:Transcript_11467/g.26683  ORF Transcript_11467/g.26683 Transcript_11467/m.26683 type:complete len:102 (+) Transcript_11467:1306-1611(+)
MDSRVSERVLTHAQDGVDDFIQNLQLAGGTLSTHHQAKLRLRLTLLESLMSRRSLDPATTAELRSWRCASSPAPLCISRVVLWSPAPDNNAIVWSELDLSV